MTKSTVKKENGWLKELYYSFNVPNANKFKKAVHKELGWSTATWYQRINGINRITPAEKFLIEHIAEKIKA